MPHCNIKGAYGTDSPEYTIYQAQAIKYEFRRGLGQRDWPAAQEWEAK